jgi:hypothetical protein
MIICLKSILLLDEVFNLPFALCAIFGIWE